MKCKVIQNSLIFTELIEFEGKTLEDFLVFYLVSKKKGNQLIHQNKITLNMQQVNFESKLTKKDTLVVELDEEVDCLSQGQEAKVVYEDDFVLIVHKDAGVMTHEDHATDRMLLTSEVAQYYINKGIQRFVRPLHRLDIATQGLVIFSKCSFFQPWFDHQLAQKKIYREYLALVSGRMKKGLKMEINKSIGKNRHDAKKMIVHSQGKDAKTVIQVLKSNEDVSLIKCELKTGRKHQIRVHLASIGYPIINDPLYGNDNADDKEMGLYAVSLGWKDPISNEVKKVDDPYINLAKIFSDSHLK